MRPKLGQATRGAELAEVSDAPPLPESPSPTRPGMPITTASTPPTATSANAARVVVLDRSLIDHLIGPPTRNLSQPRCGPVRGKRRTRIELASLAWKARAL